MTFPPPNPATFPPPDIALTWPRLRAVLLRFFAWCDRRKARHLNAFFIEAQDQAWKAQYAAWWMDGGWQEGADSPDVAYIKLRNSRR